MTLPQPTLDPHLGMVNRSTNQARARLGDPDLPAASPAPETARQRVSRLQQLVIEYVPVDSLQVTTASCTPIDQPITSRLGQADEQRLFLAMNLAKQQVAQRRSRLSVDRPDVDLLSELEGAWQRAARTKRHLIEIFFKLAVSVARQQVRRPSESDDLVGQACLTLIRAIERFDAARGFRFSTYATRAIRSELHRYVVQLRKRTPHPVDTAELIRLQDHRSSLLDQIRRGSALHAIETMMQRLEQREAHVVRSRYGLMDQPGELTLQAIADQFGVSRERVRQLEQRALRKLRRMATELDQMAVLRQFVENAS